MGNVSSGVKLISVCLGSGCLFDPGSSITLQMNSETMIFPTRDDLRHYVEDQRRQGVAFQFSAAVRKIFGLVSG